VSVRGLTAEGRTVSEEQLTPEWFAARCGKVTASRLGDLMAVTKSGPAASRQNYMAELIVERITGQPVERYSNGAMLWGTEHEPDAKAAYTFATGNEVLNVGFVPHPQIADSGASPDGLVLECGLIEVKCPNTATHIETLLSDTVAAKYVYQMQWQMACTGRDWCDFVSFDPRMPARMQLFSKRFERSPQLIDTLAREVEVFLDQLRARVAALEEQFK
jgi:putative phage-type endonuclease